MSALAFGRIDERFLRWQFRASLARQLDFLEDVLRLMADGIPFASTLEHMHRIGSPLNRVIAAALLRNLDEGDTIATAMEGVFQSDVAGAIDSAQQVGDLSETGMPVLARLREQQTAREGVLEQLAKPSLYFLLACALFAFFAWLVWPRLEAQAEADTWPAVAQYAYAIGSFIKNWWMVLAIGIGAVALSTRFVLRRWTGAVRRELDKVWPFTLYRGIVAANALDQLGTLLSAGKEPRAALDTLAAHAPPYTRMYLDRMGHGLDEGRSLSGMLDVGFISAENLARLQLLENYRNLRQTMAMTGAAARSATLKRIRHVARRLDLFGVSLVGVSFAVLVVAVYLTAAEIQAAAFR